MGPYRLSGTVRVDGTGEPVAGAKLQIHLGDPFDFMGPDQRLVMSGADGLFTADLPAGPFQISLAEPPIGYYWVSSGPGSMEALSVGPDEPVIHREYLARKGTIWAFQLTRGAERKPFPGFVYGHSSLGNRLRDPRNRLRESFEAQADDTGRLHLALPSEVADVILNVRESSRSSSRLDTGSLFLRLQSEPSFRPDELQRISPLEGTFRGFRLTDSHERSAILQAADSIEPLNDNGKLVIAAAIPARDSKDFGAVRGQVLDDKGRPIAGVHVGLAATEYRVSDELRHHSTTNADGWYRLRCIPRRKIDGAPLTFQIVVVKEGYAGFVSPPLTFKEDTTEKYSGCRSHSTGGRRCSQRHRGRLSRATGGRGQGAHQEACPP